MVEPDRTFCETPSTNTLGSWKTQCTWLRVSGHLYVTPDGVDSVRDDIMGGGLASPYPFLGATFLRVAERGFVCNVKEKLRYIGADYAQTSSPLAPNMFVSRKCCSARSQLYSVYSFTDIAEREIARNVQKLCYVCLISTAQIVYGSLPEEDLRASRRKHRHCRAERFRFAEAFSSDTVPIYGSYTLQHAIFRWPGCDSKGCLLKNLIKRGFSSTEGDCS